MAPEASLRVDESGGAVRRGAAAESDERLAALAVRGSADAFTALVDRYQGRLFRFLLARSPSRADAEDALQDTFVNAFRYLASYDSRWRFSTWLYRIAVTSALRGNEAGEVPFTEAAATDGDPLETCIGASERENLWLVAKRVLPEALFAAAWMRYAEDMPLRDIAEALGRSETWTKVALYRARRRLAKALTAAPGRAEGMRP